MWININNTNEVAQPYMWEVAESGRSLAYSENMKAKASCISAAETVKAGNVSYSTIKASDGRYYWYVSGRNSETMLRSSHLFTYESDANKERDRVKANIGTAMIYDETAKAS